MIQNFLSKMDNATNVLMFAMNAQDQLIKIALNVIQDFMFQKDLKIA